MGTCDRRFRAGGMAADFVLVECPLGACDRTFRATRWLMIHTVGLRRQNSRVPHTVRLLDERVERGV